MTFACKILIIGCILMVLLTFIEPKKLAEAGGYDERYIKAIALTRLVTGVMYGMLALDIKDVFNGSILFSVMLLGVGIAALILNIYTVHYKFFMNMIRSHNEKKL